MMRALEATCRTTTWFQRRSPGPRKETGALSFQGPLGAKLNWKSTRLRTGRL